MTRLLLVIVCALFAFVIVTNVAPDLVPEFLRPHQEHVAVPPSAQEVAKPAKPSKKASIQEAKESTEPEETAKVAVAEAPPIAVAPTRPPRPVFSVSSEQADLYLTNSLSGPPVSVLKNGEVVEPQYIINTAGQEWTYVNVVDKKISGFVRSEDLARK